MGKLSSLLVGLAALACASMMPIPSATDVAPVVSNKQMVRIALSVSGWTGKAGGSGAWQGYQRNGSVLIGRGSAGDTWIFGSPRGGSACVTGNSSTRCTLAVTRGTSSGPAETPLVIRAQGENSFVTWNGKRYRGELVITFSDSGLMVVNRLPMEAYLRGVVPLEIGNRKPEEHAAVEAQAVAARSYSYLHLVPNRAYDMMSTVQDQVYGGVDAEKPVSDAAVAATEAVVIMYAGKVVNTPYHSTCGGSTAAVHEVWYKDPDQPYLLPVSDRIPGTDRFYCDSSPRFRWTSTFTRESLRAVLEKYLSVYAGAAPGPVGRVRGVYEQGRTESNRVAALRVDTDRGSYTLRGNDIRFVMRSPDGAILNNTYFTAEATITSGEVSGLTLRGGGYGHGIGMCQWGAIGRARAGQSYRTILSTYYPGTTIGTMR